MKKINKFHLIFCSLAVTAPTLMLTSCSSITKEIQPSIFNNFKNEYVYTEINKNNRYIFETNISLNSKNNDLNTIKNLVVNSPAEIDIAKKISSTIGLNEPFDLTGWANNESILTNEEKKAKYKEFKIPNILVQNKTELLNKYFKNTFFVNKYPNSKANSQNFLSGNDISFSNINNVIFDCYITIGRKTFMLNSAQNNTFFDIGLSFVFKIKKANFENKNIFWKGVNNNYPIEIKFKWLSDIKGSIFKNGFLNKDVKLSNALDGDFIQFYGEVDSSVIAQEEQTAIDSVGKMVDWLEGKRVGSFVTTDNANHILAPSVNQTSRVTRFDVMRNNFNNLLSEIKPKLKYDGRLFNVVCNQFSSNKTWHVNSNVEYNINDLIGNFSTYVNNAEGYEIKEEQKNVKFSPVAVVKVDDSKKDYIAVFSFRFTDRSNMSWYGINDSYLKSLPVLIYLRFNFKPQSQEPQQPAV